MHRVHTLVVALTLSLAACDLTGGSSPAPTRAPCDAAPRSAGSSISGALVDRDGAPVKSGRVIAELGIQGSEGGCFLVDADGGRYDLPVEPAIYGVMAWWGFDWEDERYWLRMVDDDDFLYATIDAHSPATADFRVLDSTPSAEIEIRWGLDRPPEANGSVLAFTLTPTRPTATGSTESFSADLLD